VHLVGQAASWACARCVGVLMRNKIGPNLQLQPSPLMGSMRLPISSVGGAPAGTGALSSPPPSTTSCGATAGIAEMTTSLFSKTFATAFSCPGAGSGAAYLDSGFACSVGLERHVPMFARCVPQNCFPPNFAVFRTWPHFQL
jgi:hypothetical protein